MFSFRGTISCTLHNKKKKKRGAKCFIRFSSTQHSISKGGGLTITSKNTLTACRDRRLGCLSLHSWWNDKESHVNSDWCVCAWFVRVGVVVGYLGGLIWRPLSLFSRNSRLCLRDLRPCKSNGTHKTLKLLETCIKGSVAHSKPLRTLPKLCRFLYFIEVDGVRAGCDPLHYIIFWACSLSWLLCNL